MGRPGQPGAVFELLRQLEVASLTELKQSTTRLLITAGPSGQQLGGDGEQRTGADRQVITVQLLQQAQGRPDDLGRFGMIRRKFRDGLGAP